MFFKVHSFSFVLRLLIPFYNCALQSDKTSFLSDSLRIVNMDGSRELKTLKPVHIPRSSGGSDAEAHSSYDRDQDELARLGKKQVLKVCRLNSEFPNIELRLRSGILHLCPCWVSAVR